jgi:hypothetical protein
MQYPRQKPPEDYKDTFGYNVVMWIVVIILLFLMAGG